jgi:hypothetical protein
MPQSTDVTNVTVIHHRRLHKLIPTNMATTSANMHKGITAARRHAQLSRNMQVALAGTPLNCIEGDHGIDSMSSLSFRE